MHALKTCAKADNAPYLSTLIVGITSLLITASSIVAAGGLPDDGLSVSVKSTMNAQGNFNSSGYRFDPNFQLNTNGKVGRNGKVGNVKAAKITGINTSLKSMPGSMSISGNVKNEPDITHIELTNKALGDVPQKTISMGTASPAEFKQLPNFKGQYSITGLWMNSSDFCMNCEFSFTTGMFIDGTVSPIAEKAKQSQEISTFTGALDGMPEGECDGECEWGLKASFKAEMSQVDLSITINTTDSFIHYKNTQSGKSSIKPRPDLNITGQLSFDDKQNLFKGKIKDGRGVSGTAYGRYYGPNHNEVAIVYSLGKANPESMQMGVMFGGR